MGWIDYTWHLVCVGFIVVFFLPVFIAWRELMVPVYDGAYLHVYQNSDCEGGSEVINLRHAQWSRSADQWCTTSSGW